MVFSVFLLRQSFLFFLIFFFPCCSQAAYYIGLGCRVVLCLQKLQPNIPISSEEVGTEKSSFVDLQSGFFPAVFLSYFFFFF